MVADEVSSRRVALIGTAAALLGSLIGVVGGLAGVSLQLRHEDAVDLRETREALYTRVLKYERSAIDRPLTQLIREEERVRQGLGQTTAPPGFRLPENPTSVEVAALQLSISSPQRIAEYEGLRAELMVYGSRRSVDLVTTFLSAEVEEYGAALDIARSRTDNDVAAEGRLIQARADMLSANEALADLVRTEVVQADG